MLAEYIGVAQLNDFIARGVTLNETLAVADLPRLAGLVHRRGDDTPENLDVRVEFNKLGGDIPGIKVTVNGTVEIKCQRCLEALTWNVDNAFELQVRAADTRMDEIEDTIDTVLVDEHGLQLATVIEDEILSAMPLAPSHHRSEECGKLVAVYERVADSPSAGPENRPFSDLADLIGKADPPEK
ncbi:MAG: YceD family protein [Gammaproteobacteria bacterium]|nr:YceD family protein [Gammaproteobacteria bacterium]